METKKCKTCELELPLNRFHKYKSKSGKEYLHNHCKACRVRKVAVYRRTTEGKEKLKIYRSEPGYLELEREYHKRWRLANPDATLNHRLRTLYGMNLETYLQILEKQGT